LDARTELHGVGFGRLRHGYLLDLACDCSARHATILARGSAKADVSYLGDGIKGNLIGH
jgi:hypothetical protein